MEKRKGGIRKYLYFAVSIALVIIIVVELSNVSAYHSISGVDEVNIPISDQTSYIVIAKLPGVMARANIFLTKPFYPYGNLSINMPDNGSTASLGIYNMNSSRFSPEISVQFNSTSGSMAGTSVAISPNLTMNLTSFNPVAIMIVPGANYTGLSPGVFTTPSYDYMIIEVNSVTLMSYEEVSR